MRQWHQIPHCFVANCLIDSLTIDIWGQTPGITSIQNWNSEIQNLKTFAEQRAPYASQYLSDRFGLSGRANLLLSTNIQNEGKISVNDFFQQLGDNLLYFKGIPITLQAYPPPGYKFKQWTNITNTSIISTDSIITYSLTGDVELRAEFDFSN